jgi:hypothetical protein
MGISIKDGDTVTGISMVILFKARHFICDLKAMI